MQRLAIIAALVLLGGGLLMALSGKGGAPSSEGPAVTPPSTPGLNMVRGYAMNAGLPKVWQDFFAFVAARESNGKNLVGLGVPQGAPPYIKLNHGPAEAVAAKRAYDRNADDYASCWPEAVYTWGSGGWFAILPGNGLRVFVDANLRCVHPWAVIDPAMGLVMGIGMARRLMDWGTFKANPTVLTLRVGWGDPSDMGNASVLAAKRPGYEKDAAEAGLPASFLDTVLDVKPPLTGGAVALATALGADVDAWLPKGGKIA